ncbi:dihydrofolate reductase [Inmirania thermothiophila]|uniref:Dihydrofolate reductase n=1 Tax=Inmirania thermothiophila TaxID=1750597 RepID=A0A3N1Y756_9GAMM|nr:dihydrofolate reductase [Inmirania thermothiophila]ROR34659.1 dihydrofolate reductase [Inmirania thermothiophila]
MSVLSLIAAIDEGGLIGRGNALPWRLPADLRHFRAVTWGKPVVMGRRTFESIGRPLPGRRNIVVTRDPDWRAAGCERAASPEAALALAAGAREVMVIGGAALYRHFLPRADRLYLTRIHHRFEGDAWFPPIDPAQWVEVAREDHAPDADNPWPYSFLVLERRA